MTTNASLGTRLQVPMTLEVRACFMDWLIRDLAPLTQLVLGGHLEDGEFMAMGHALAELPTITADHIARQGRLRPFVRVCRDAADLNLDKSAVLWNAYTARHGKALTLPREERYPRDGVISQAVDEAADRARYSVVGSKAGWWAYQALGSAHDCVRAAVVDGRPYAAAVVRAAVDESYGRLVDAVQDVCPPSTHGYKVILDPPKAG